MPPPFKTPSAAAARMFDPPSPHSRDPDDPQVGQAMIVPGSSSFGGYGLLNAVAGPSSERRESAQTDASSPDAPFTPSSAPATPSASGTTHPPEYIHTHFPRRGSMTPLGLNVISPRAPVAFPSGGVTPTQTFSPTFTMQRSVGFNPTGVPQPDSSPTIGSSSIRRNSVASTSSTLTQSRPIPPSSNSNPAYNRDRRRSSITPLHPTLAPPSPSRHIAKGRHSRPSSSDGPSSGASALHTRTRTEPPSKTIGAIARDDYKDTVGEFGRRGSMPHLAYGASSSRAWNPSLPPPRGSVGDEETMPDDGFRFGSIPSSPAAAALRAIDQSPSSRRSSFLSGQGGSLPRGDVFEEAEAEEAEKQRRAFIAATFGVDGKRARERLSIGGPSAASPNVSPGNTMRRPSLMLWEKLGMQAAQRAVGPLEVGSASVPTLPTMLYDDGDLGHRRGSLPIAIPGGVLGRSVSKKEQKEARIHDMDAPIIVRTDTDAEEESDEEDEAEESMEADEFGQRLTPPVRPLPPLLPLSDPGPRLLPSTLALHRASHLLNARNLQPEPLPHPLPPSLHPPAPVDLAEFDIDFILAGSQAQLGGDKKAKNAHIDTSLPPRADAPATPTLRLGSGGEDDTFAKFVGQFDDEYGDRRGEWTFRSSTVSSSADEELRDPLDASASREAIKAEWESIGAGKYELYGNGEVRSVKSGSVWRVKKVGGREYELEEVKKGLAQRLHLQTDSANPQLPVVTVSNESYFLAGKAQHSDCGGVKFASTIRLPRQAASRANSTSIPAPRASQIRASISDGVPRAERIGSEDSAMTSRQPISSSVPLSSAIQAMLPNKKKRQESHSAPKDEDDSRGRPSVSFLQRADAGKKERSLSRDRGEKDKKKGGFGGVLKRGLASIKHGSHAAEEKKALKEEKERERMQSQSWSGAGPSHRDHPSWMHPSGRTNSTSHGVHGAQQFFSHPGSGSQRKSSISIGTGTLTPSQSSIEERERTRVGGVATPRSDDQDRRSEVIADEDAAHLREGPGWAGVPEDAVAMVIPIESDGQSGPAGMISHVAHGSSTPSPDAHRQALLVWFVPFDSEGDRPGLTTIASSASSSRETVGSGEPSGSSGSLPKFQKLLRRRASKERDGLKTSTPPLSALNNSSTRLHPHVSFSSTSSCQHYPLPFRSFRIVARAVDWEELRTNATPLSPSVGFNQWAEHNPPAPARSNTGGTSISNASSSFPSPNPGNDLLPEDSPEAGGSTSTAPTSTVGTGRNFPTVIAVCHSRTQGVEFVLEGLDRLGFCQGESAWGPTGYEEWRGSGLSDKGRELLDLLWAGCVAVLGIAA